MTNTIITLDEFNSKVERQFIFFTDSVRCQQPNWKYSGKQKCVSFEFFSSAIY